MRTSLLARGRGLRRCACRILAAGALVAALAGCTAAASSSVTVAGQTLTIYSSLPPARGSSEAEDVFAAEQLALRQGGSQIGNLTVRLARLQGRKISDNARTAIQDTSAIAYLGEFVPGDSAASVGITNSQDLLQVSPTDTAVALTQATPAVPRAPNLYYESLKSYGRTFARVVPTSALEARALVGAMQSLHVSRLYVRSDGSDYGKALAQGVKDDLGSAITPASSEAGADGILYAGSSFAAAADTFNRAAAGNPSARLFAPSALAAQAMVSALTPAAQRALYATVPGFYKNLPAAGQKFQADFEATFGHAPAPEAIFGYEAMASVLAVLREAGSAATNRATVVRDYFATKNRQSVLGTYSISSSGDTSLDAFTASQVRGGRLVPFKALVDQG
jgi:branched-chain amino acid transport system substrate-binding protein